MTEAAEIESARPWRVEYPHGIEGDGIAGQTELANACAMVWLSALKWYYTDAAAAMRGKSYHGDNGESLDDLTGSRELLARLCKPLGADPQRIGDAMIEALDAGRKFDTGRMNRVVPERVEDYGTWQGKRKRKTRSPWRETGGGLGQLSGRR